MQRVLPVLYKALLAGIFTAALAIIGWASNRAVTTFDKMDLVHQEILVGIQGLNSKLALEVNSLRASIRTHEQVDLLTFRPVTSQLQDHENRIRAVEGRPLVPFRYGP